MSRGNKINSTYCSEISLTRNNVPSPTTVFSFTDYSIFVPPLQYLSHNCCNTVCLSPPLKYFSSPSIIVRLSPSTIVCSCTEGACVRGGCNANYTFNFFLSQKASNQRHGNLDLPTFERISWFKRLYMNLLHSCFNINTAGDEIEVSFLGQENSWIWPIRLAAHLE